MVAVPSIGRADRAAPQRVAPEADATRRLYEQYARQIYAYCLHQLGNREEAEDATQSTFLNAFRGLKRGIDPEFETAWLYKIAQNVCLTRQRSSSRRRRVESPGDLDAMQDVLPAREADPDDLINLPEALNQMPDQQRRALLLREWQGLSYREIGDELGLSQPAVETLLFRARRSLAAGLTEEPKRSLAKRMQNGGDATSLLALAKSLLLTGGTKVMATVATIAATSVVAATPVMRHAVVNVVDPKPPAYDIQAAAPTTSVAPSAGPATKAVTAATLVAHAAVLGPVAPIRHAKRHTSRVHAAKVSGFVAHRSIAPAEPVDAAVALRVEAPAATTPAVDAPAPAPSASAPTPAEPDANAPAAAATPSAGGDQTQSASAGPGSKHQDSPPTTSTVNGPDHAAKTGDPQPAPRNDVAAAPPANSDGRGNGYANGKAKKDDAAAASAAPIAPPTVVTTTTTATVTTTPAPAQPAANESGNGNANANGKAKSDDVPPAPALTPDAAAPAVTTPAEPGEHGNGKKK